MPHFSFHKPVRAGQLAWLRRPRIVCLLLVAGLALFVAGCVDITGVTYDDNTEAGPEYTIMVHLKPVADLDDVRGTLAFRHPAGWIVKSVTYKGAHLGTATYSPVITNWFETTWDADYGAKGGYVWWAGYSGGPYDAKATDSYQVKIVVDTRGSGGNLTFDLVGGFTNETSPESLAASAYWGSGTTYTGSPGQELNLAVHLDSLTIPTVTAFLPADGASGLPPDVSPTVTFSEPMDPNSINLDNVYLTWVGGTADDFVAATLVYDPSTRKATIDPMSPLTPDREYLIVADVDCTDLVGNHAIGAHAAFTVAPAAVAPTVTAVSPADDATGVEVGTNVTATFDLAMDEATLTNATFTLIKQLVMVPTPLPALVSYSAATKTVTLNPAVDLEPGVVYQARLSTGVESAEGMALASSHTWSFTTAEEEEPPPAAFTDVPSGAPYHDAIQGMADAGIINGYPRGDGTSEFRPNNPVWRWQFAKMIVGALDVPCTESMTSPFTDLDPDDTTKLDMTEFVAAAFDKGITKGSTATLYKPYTEISRAQVVTMVVRAVQSMHPDLLAVPPTDYSNAWGTAFSADHGQNARIAEHNGLLAGLPLSGAASDPWGSMPRGEVAQVLWNVMEKLAD